MMYHTTTTPMPLAVGFCLAWQETASWQGWVVVEYDRWSKAWHTMDEQRDVLPPTWWVSLPLPPPGYAMMGAKPERHVCQPHASQGAVWVGVWGQWGDGNVGV